MKWKNIIVNNGYTLIEILVAITIIGIIFGVGYVSFRDFSRRQAIISVARNMEGDVKVAQEKALSGQKTCSVGVLDGYDFYISGNTYAIREVCSGVPVLPAVKTVDLSALGVASIVTTSADGSTPPNPVMYKTLGQGTNITSTLTITLTQVATNNTAQATLGVAGVIRR
jgi:prepilin-type N-terminal cleavage/methylation domain-containing protein